MSIENIRLLKQQALIPKRKTIYSIPKKSAKKIAKEKQEKELGSDNDMDKFFEKMRKRLTGTCQCGCGTKTQKDDDTFYRNCICHIFPKRLFPTIATNELNWVERNFWNGDHSNMDNRSIELWKNFADWDDIKEKFYQLAPLLTDEERATKFYHNIENLIYGK